MEPPIPQNLPCHAHPWNNLRGGAVMVWISTFDHVNIGTRGSKSEASSLPVIPSPLQYSTCRPISDSGDPWGGSGLGWYSGVCCTGILGGLLVSRRRGVTDRFVVNACHRHTADVDVETVLFRRHSGAALGIFLGIASPPLFRPLLRYRRDFGRTIRTAPLGGTQTRSTHRCFASNQTATRYREFDTPWSPSLLELS